MLYNYKLCKLSSEVDVPFCIPFWKKQKLLLSTPLLACGCASVVGLGCPDGCMMGSHSCFPVFASWHTTWNILLIFEAPPSNDTLGCRLVLFPFSLEERNMPYMVLSTMVLMLHGLRSQRNSWPLKILLQRCASLCAQVPLTCLCSYRFCF